MSNTNRWLAVACAAAVLLSAACSSSSNSSESSNTTAASPVPGASAESGAMNGTSNAMNGAPGAMTGRSPEPIPATLHCGTGAIVWVNISRKDYHLPGDRYYGLTKHGKYMCQSDADAGGYRMAGTPSSHTGSTSMTPQPSST